MLPFIIDMNQQDVLTRTFAYIYSRQRIFSYICLIAIFSNLGLHQYFGRTDLTMALMSFLPVVCYTIALTFEYLIFKDLKWRTTPPYQTRNEAILIQKGLFKSLIILGSISIFLSIYIFLNLFKFDNWYTFFFTCFTDLILWCNTLSNLWAYLSLRKIIPLLENEWQEQDDTGISA